ncbi:MAG: hypothetical protein ACLVIY_09100 [Anaerobutyricum soehngenii]
MKNGIYRNEFVFDNDFDVYKIEKELNIKPSRIVKEEMKRECHHFDKNKHLEAYVGHWLQTHLRIRYKTSN